ncbi:MAG: P-loop NTPase [Propionibacteriaceae bacterium]|jgi:secretion/DNA translocation related CpaE-like protein|nr:P-loop NTPase [Propionibacteriaceae bacterium]
MNDILAVTKSVPLAELVLTTAAALELGAEQVDDPAQLPARWESAAAVCVGQDLAAAVASLALPRREAVILLGEDESVLARWSAPLEALVIPLPDGALWLGSVLDEGVSRANTPVLAVLGGSGGVGASTLAAGLALAQAKSGAAVALVDADVAGGGIDLLLGLEHVGGWRWPSLAAAEGYIGDLRGFVPQIDTVSVLSMARADAGELRPQALTAVLQSLRRSHSLVVLDVGRTQSPVAREAVRLATDRLLLLNSSVRSVAAAAQTLQAFHTQARVVVRGKSSAGLNDAAIADILSLPIAGQVRDESAVAAAATRGDPPRHRGFLKDCAKLLPKSVAEPARHSAARAA